MGFDNFVEEIMKEFGEEMVLAYQDDLSKGRIVSENYPDIDARFRDKKLSDRGIIRIINGYLERMKQKEEKQKEEQY